MAHVPSVRYPRQPQQMMNGGTMQPGQGPMQGGPMNNLPPRDPPGMTNPGMGMPLGAPQVRGNVTSSAMAGSRGSNTIGRLQHDQGVHALTESLAMANLLGGGAGSSMPGGPPFGSGQSPFPGPRDDRLRVSASPPTPSPTDSSITAPSPSAVVNGMPMINPATQPTSTLPEVPVSFLTHDFIQSVAGSLEDFDPQALFRPDDAGIDFERDFREWFNPDDLEMR